MKSEIVFLAKNVRNCNFFWQREQDQGEYLYFLLLFGFYCIRIAFDTYCTYFNNLTIFKIKWKTAKLARTSLPLFFCNFCLNRWNSTTMTTTIQKDRLREEMKVSLSSPKKGYDTRVLLS